MSDAEPNAQIGANILTKFNFYFLGLTFGILALSIQTATFQTPLPARIAELVGWVFLLTSGIVGLSRVEWMPTQYQLTGLRVDTEHRIHGLQKAVQEGTRVVHVTLERRDRPIEDLIAQAESDLAKLGSHIGMLDRTAMKKYRVQKYSFVIGLAAIMVSRGYAPILDILRDLQ